ncbi:MAG: peptidylprolyl isomerase, partial [Gammaproteobacteria bacterium]|nr:peptidylprolyl isomerase [Gammaproteobacteria bacterium]
MRVYRDPLAHFLVLGVLLFFSYYWLNPEQGNSIIEVSEGTIARLEQKWEILWNRKPTEKELRGLVEAYTREEILSREALAMGLDRDDPVIRRRLAQKVDFLLDDISDLGQPDDDKLMEYYLNNPDQFSIGPFFSFYHVYLNPEKYADPADTVSKLLQTLRAGAVLPKHAGDYGDPFFNGDSFHHQSKSQINRIFGKGFAETVVGLRLNEWSDPVQSGLGLH